MSVTTEARPGEPQQGTDQAAKLRRASSAGQSGRLAPPPQASYCNPRTDPLSELRTLPELIDRLNRALEGRYVVDREIGHGGWAIVYLARDLRNRRRVALKVLRPEIAEGLGGDRFLREIEIAANLTHPNILPLHDSGDADGLLYYVMPYVEGETLRQRLNREKQLPLEDVWEITRELSDALGYAHSQGIVHRDIKPENVLLEEGHAVISDFGIARAVSAAAGDAATETGVAVGTPLYMSPEQGTGETDLDTRSDVYSLGCCVWEMLAGDPPYTGPTAQAVLARKAAEPLPHLRTVRETVPEEVEQAISKALARVPADRYATAHAFQQALARGMRKSAQFRAIRQRRRFYALVSLGGIVAIAVIVQLVRGPGMRLEPNRVVVATFENQSGDPELATFGGIAQDWITQGLMASEDLDVLPLVSARGAWEFVQRQFEEGRVRDRVRALAQETGAAIVVTGTYYPIGDSVMIQSTVTDASRRRSLGLIQPVHGPGDNPVGALQEVRDQIAGLLAVTRDERLAPSVGAASRPPSYEAYRAFSDGMEHYVRQEWHQAVPYFARAYALDATFVRSLLYESLSLFNTRAWREADSVLQIAAQSRDQLTAYDRYFLDYRTAFLAADPESARHAIRRAAEIAPGSKAEYNLALELYESNHLRESREVLGHLDPTRGPMRDWLGYWRVLSGAYHLEGDHQRERRVAQRARRILSDPSGTLLLEVRAVAALGQSEAVAALLAEAHRISDDGSGESVAELTAVAAMELRVHGYAEEAAAMFQRAADSYEGLGHETLSVSARTDYARVLYALQRWDESRALHAALAAEYPQRIAHRAQLGLIAARQGDMAAAEQIETWLAHLSDRYRLGEHAYYRGTIAAVLGKHQVAVGLLREAFGQRWPQGSMVVHRDFDLESLYDYPPYVALMEPKP